MYALVMELTYRCDIMHGKRLCMHAPVWRQVGMQGEGLAKMHEVGGWKLSEHCNLGLLPSSVLAA